MLRYQLEEYKPARPIWGWIIVIVTAILTLGWGMIVHMAVPDVERRWDFGQVPDAPGESAFSTVPPPREQPVPPQIELPVEDGNTSQPPASAGSDLKSQISNLSPSRDG